MRAALLAVALLLGVALANAHTTQLSQDDIDDLLAVRTYGGRDCKDCHSDWCAKVAKCGKCKYEYYAKKCPKTCNNCKPAPTGCHDVSSHWCPKVAKCGKCKYSHYAKKCPVSCGTCTPECKDADRMKCNIYAGKGYCKYEKVAKYCPKSCDKCEKETPTPTPTPTPTSTPTPTPTASPTPTPTPTPTASPGPTPTGTTSPSPSPTLCPGVKTEICWIADLDTSRGAEGWEQIQRFIRKSITAMDSLFPDPTFVLDLGVLAGTGAFDTADSTEVGQNIIDFFNTFEHLDSEGSQIELALKRCRQLMVAPEYKKVVVLITDGNGEELTGEDLKFYQLENQANKLKDEGAEIFTVAIGAEGNENRLRKLSGKANSDVEHLHKIDKYVTSKSFENYAKKMVACI